MADPYVFGDRIEQVVTWHAMRCPEAIALEFARHQVTYRELMSTASGLARALAELDVGAGDVVPILAARSPDLVYAALGVLLAGAAYVAIDPAWPSGRINAVIGQLDAKAVLVDRTDRAEALDPGAPPHIQIAALTHPASGPWATAPDDATGADAACVYFTSGSTGTPKGIISPHRGTVRTVIGCPSLPMDTATVTLQASSLSWDAFSLELWSALLNGGTCVLLNGPNLEMTAIIDALDTHEVNTLWLTSSLFSAMVNDALTELGQARLIMTGGERVSLAHARRLLSAHPDVRLVNGYGPGEATIFATTHAVTSDDVRPERSELPIGRPISQTGIVIAGDELRPLPPGTTGEILISGHGLALGYLNDPPEARDRFVFLEQPGGPVRFYRTGDLGMADASGQLWYRGRLDRQVKNRNVRIEPGEVEAVMERYPAIGQCIVEPAPGAGPGLVAFYTATAEIPRSKLHAHASKYLLPEMIPGRFIKIDELPLTQHGKVDHSALQETLTLEPGANWHQHVARRYYELIDSSRFSEAAALFHDEVIYERQGTPTIHGREDLLHFYQHDRVIAEGKHQLEQVLAEGNWVAVRGQFQGRLRNGEPVEVRFTDWHRFRGKFIDYRNTLYPGRQVLSGGSDTSGGPEQVPRLWRPASGRAHEASRAQRH
jgi:amino acid adenylation domain-containing protein